MNYADESYVRKYTRKTETYRDLGWEGRAVLDAMLGEFDRAGMFSFRKTAAAGVSSVTEIPLEVVHVGLQRLLDTETWFVRGNDIVWPNYVEAQNCRKSDRIRQQESRAARNAGRGARNGSSEPSPPPRDLSHVSPVSPPVTNGHPASHESPLVTPSLAQPSQAQPSSAEDSSSESPAAAPPPAAFGTTPVEDVFHEWQRVHQHGDAKLDGKRTARIRAALKLHSAEDLKRAVRGALKDEWLMGRDPKSPRKYDGLETILRDTAQIERLIDLDSGKARPARRSSSGSRQGDAGKRGDETFKGIRV